MGCQIGWDRVLLGKHFPTDIQAGRVLAKAIVRELDASEVFQHDPAAAKAAKARATLNLIDPIHRRLSVPAAKRHNSE